MRKKSTKSAEPKTKPLNEDAIRADERQRTIEELASQTPWALSDPEVDYIEILVGHQPSQEDAETAACGFDLSRAVKVQEPASENVGSGIKDNLFFCNVCAEHMRAEHRKVTDRVNDMVRRLRIIERTSDPAYTLPSLMGTKPQVDDVDLGQH